MSQQIAIHGHVERLYMHCSSSLEAINILWKCDLPEMAQPFLFNGILMLRMMRPYIHIYLHIYLCHGRFLRSLVILILLQYMITIWFLRNKFLICIINDIGFAFSYQCFLSFTILFFILILFDVLGCFFWIYCIANCSKNSAVVKSKRKLEKEDENIFLIWIMN